MKAMKKLLVLVLALATVICLAVPAFAADGYTDVNEKDWFAGAVEYATENGMMNGMGENLFQPATTSTRGMVVTILHRLDGEPKASVEVKFDDLKQDWYKAAIAWAYENGVVEGYSETKFGPEDVITREQLATMAYRYAVNYLGLDGSAAGDLSVFTDAAKVSTWAKDAMVWAIGEGLIKGYEDNTLNPQGQANRAELATILMRLDQNVVTHTHELEHVEAAEPTCHKRGNAEYWYCAGCDCYFTDAEGKYNIAYLSLVTPATDVLYQEAVEACHANGTQEYWYCEKCDTVFADAACTIVTNRKNLTLVADEALVHVPAKAASCHTKGNIEYWYCETCDLVSTDAAGTLVSNFKNVTIPASDVIYQEAVEACHANGTQEYWYCETCDAVFTDAECTQLTNRKNLTLEADEELVHVEAVEATCHKNGNVEYWYCETCQLVSTNKEGTAVSNFKNVVVPATDLIYQEEVPACHLNGTLEYWYCEKCDVVFADAACTIVTNRKNLTLEAVEGTLTHVKASEPTCHQDGYKEHWFCETCKGVYTDAECTQLSNIKNVTIAAKPLAHQEEVPACHLDGTLEYWFCETCDAVFTDSQGTQLSNRKNLTLEADEELTHVVAKAASCHQPGNIEYWYCETCDAVYTDAAGTKLSNNKDVHIPAEPLAHQEAVPACHLDGTLEYWFCETCQDVFTDAQGTQISNRKNLTLEADEELTHVEAADPTCHQPGNLEYWYCETCDLVYTDAAGTKLSNIKNVQIPAEPLAYSAPKAATCDTKGYYGYWYCEECEAVFADQQGTQMSNRQNLTIPATGLHTYEDHQCTVCYNYDGCTADCATVLDVEYPVTIALDANETIYVTGRVGGQILTINNAADAVVTLNETKYVAAEGVVTVEIPAVESFWDPNPVLAISSELGGEFVLNFEFPVGNMMNPKVLTEIDSIEAAVEAGDNQGYYYSWTATEDGTLTITAKDYVAGKYAVELSAESSYAYPVMPENDGTEAEGTVSIEVVAGDVVTIHFVAIPEFDSATYSQTYNAAEATLTGAFVAAE